jgi:radical SAM superfamily enzyme YgiQ (UPF0313 family)
MIAHLDGATTLRDLVARGEIGPISTAVLETHLGCPFACTFCDWGQAAQSRQPRGQIECLA